VEKSPPGVPAAHEYDDDMSVASNVPPAEPPAPASSANIAGAVDRFPNASPAPAAADASPATGNAGTETTFRDRSLRTPGTRVVIRHSGRSGVASTQAGNDTTVNRPP